MGSIIRKYIWWGVSLLLVWACEPDYSPKPKEYPFIPLPEPAYQLFQTHRCPFQFEQSVYSELFRDSQIVARKPTEDCWVNIHYPDYNATIYLSYKQLSEDYSLQKLRNDAHRLTYEHTKKADFIDPQYVETPFNTFGVIYHVGGDAASSTQFFATDTLQHWLRGSLYFNNEPNADSLAPVIAFINQDILHLIETLRWQYGQ